MFCLPRGSVANRARAFFSTSLIVLSLLAGCDRTGEGPAFARGEGGGNGLAAQPAVPVAVHTAVVGPIASYYKATATLEVEKEAEILARVQGIVESIDVEEGDFVASGDSLLRIENDEYDFLLRVAESKTKNLQSRLERMKELSQDLVSAEEFETVQNDLKTAEAERGMARLNLSYTSVTAPFRGRITRRHVDVGQNVSIGTSLFALADLEPLLARVHVPSKEFRRIQIEQEVELVLDSTGQRLRGRITLVSPTIDPRTGTIKVTIEVPEYPEETRPGDFAEVQIVTEQRLASTLIPRIAVITDKGEQVVYVDALGAAERRVVEVGFTTDERTEIIGGVEPGERVVVKGQRSLKHGAPLKVIEESPPATAPQEGAGS